MICSDPTTNRQDKVKVRMHSRISDKALVLFTRVPVAGKSKTRLQSELTPQQCADVQLALICDTVEELSYLDCSIVVSYAPDHEGQENAPEIFAAFRRKLEACYTHPNRSLTFIRQEGESLGERMDDAFNQVFSMGAKQCLLMGSDIPNVHTSELNRLFRKLDTRDAVLCPSQDGGYWLVGLRERFQELFDEKSYGGDDVFRDALLTCTKHDREFAIGPQKLDIDTPRQLRRYSLQLKNNAHACHHIADMLYELRLLSLANEGSNNNSIHSNENDDKENLWNDSLTQANQAP